jgi:hypothetical protein
VCINVPGDQTVTYSTGGLQVATLACGEGFRIQGATNGCILFIVTPSFVLGDFLLANADTTLWVYNRLDIGGLFTWSAGAKLKGAGATHANGGVAITDIVYWTDIT